MRIKNIDIAYHRNGVAGAGFHVILFKDFGTGGSRKVGIVFDQDGHCAVLDMAKLAGGDIAFGSNSWRGDDYERPLRKAIESYEQSRIRR